MKIISSIAVAAVGLAAAEEPFCCYYPTGADACNPGVCIGKTSGQPQSWCSGTWCPGGPPPTPKPTPAPTPAAPTPPTAPTPAPKVPLYCPQAKDLTVAYGSGTVLKNQGWELNGNTGAATKASFNMVGGYAEYDIDFTGVPVGVNANIYTISPKMTPAGYTGDVYCDGADNDSPWCTEVDWIESNGNCGGATTLHTIPHGGNGCTAWGCKTVYHYNGKTKFHMRHEYTEDGEWKITRDGQVLYLNPAPTSSDHAELKKQYSELGAVIYSSQWAGWTPVEDCGAGGDLPSAKFSISNLKIFGKVIQGPTPTLCSEVEGGLKKTFENVTRW